MYEEFQKDLQRQLELPRGSKVQLKINNNRSTMLSVRWEPDCTKVSLHRIFMEAPGNVMQQLGCYVRQEQDDISLAVKAFIEDKLQKLDYSHELDMSKLYCQGNIYNLQRIYNDLNNAYFRTKLKLNITWFGKTFNKNRSRLTFGLYHEPIKLIKVHRLLDSPSFPDYVVAYVVYHEMVHHVCPSYYDENGNHRVHSKEFKEQELKFKYFDLAQKWIEDHSNYLFNSI
jgi:hypothetical protein